MNTKEKILDASLDLFSLYGYQDTSVAQIAAAVGIKAPSLYKHYKSKQAIFDALVKKMDQQYFHQISMLKLNTLTTRLAANPFSHISEEELIKTVWQLFQFFLWDPYISRFRKMMILEQSRHSGIARIYEKQYFDDPINFQTELFRQLCSAGVLTGSDPRSMALSFYSPIFTLLNLCDQNPARTDEAEKLLRNHIHEFNRIYKREANK